MLGSDSVSIFAEGTFEEQIQELVNYIVRAQPEEERAASIRPFQDALKGIEGDKPLAEDEARRKKVFALVLSSVKNLGDGSEKEIEGFFNLIYSHLLELYVIDSSDLREQLSILLQTVYSAPTQSTSIKYRILSNLFNAIPRESQSRLRVYETLLKIATENDELGALQLTRADVDKWLSEWDIPREEKSEFLNSLVDAYNEAGQPATAYDYSLLYVASLPSSAPAAHEAAVLAIATALRLPSLFDYDPLFKLEAVIAAKEHDLFTLLQVFLNDGLPEFHSWTSCHSGVLEKYELDQSQLERKIRLLTLASLAFKHVGQNLPYSQIASALQVDEADAEKWVIDAIRAGLVSGKLSQVTKTFHVTRVTARTFEREQWEALEKRLVAWKAGLTSVLEVVANAKRQGGLGVSNAQVQATA